MQVSKVLLRGMVAGLLAALLAFGFALLLGEPSVDRAIAFESAMHETEMAEAAKAGHAHMDDDPDIFSRTTQAGIGLFTAVVVVGVAIGGLFALVFAFGYGRLSTRSPKAFAALLGVACFVVVYLVPDLKYPANPPSIGAPATIGARTALYFGMIALSIVAAIAASSLRRALDHRLGAWNAALAGATAFVGLVALAMVLLPHVDEVPAGFPAQVLWNFRLASLGIQLILWGGTGLLFGVLTERALATSTRN